MKPGGMRIETIRARDLGKFYRDYVNAADGQQISPISQYRAESQSKNPYADEDDAGLLVAYYGDQCVGYQGIVPGLLRTRSGLGKVYWGTAAYVLPEFRKRMVAIQLIKKFTSLKKDIVLTGFDSVVADVFKGFHFQEIGPLAYLTLRPDRLDPFSFPFRRFYRLQKKWPVARKMADSAIGLSKRLSYPQVRNAFYRSVAGRAEKALKGVRWRETHCLEGVPAGSQRAAATGPRFERGPATINWMLENPWIREEGAVARPPYYFSEIYKQFRYVALVIDGPDKPGRSFVVLSLVRENDESKLKVLDLSCDEQDADALFWLICKYAADQRADEIEMPALFARQVSLLPLGSFAMKPETRRYLCRPCSPESSLALALPELALDLSDGDCAFT